jgi:hypothetical protein
MYLSDSQYKWSKLMNESMISAKYIGHRNHSIDFYMVDCLKDFQDGAVVCVNESFVEGKNGRFFVLPKSHVERVGIETFTDMEKPKKPFFAPNAYFISRESEKDKDIWLKRIDQYDSDLYCLDDESFNGFSWTWSAAMPEALFS